MRGYGHSIMSDDMNDKIQTTVTSDRYDDSEDDNYDDTKAIPEGRTQRWNDTRHFTRVEKSDDDSYMERDRKHLLVSRWV